VRRYSRETNLEYIGLEKTKDVLKPASKKGAISPKPQEKKGEIKIPNAHKESQKAIWKGKAKDIPRGKNKWKKVELIKRNPQNHNIWDKERRERKNPRSEQGKAEVNKNNSPSK